LSTGIFTRTFDVRGLCQKFLRGLNLVEIGPLFYLKLKLNIFLSNILS